MMSQWSFDGFQRASMTFSDVRRVVGEFARGSVMIDDEGVSLGGVDRVVNGIGCPLTSTPPSEQWHPNTIIGQNGIEENSNDRMCLAAPGFLR